MRRDILPLLRCPACQGGGLQAFAWREGQDDTIADGVVGCGHCSTWYPIEDRLLEFLIAPLAYKDDRERFWNTHAQRLIALGLRKDDGGPPSPKEGLQSQQQAYFDSYSLADEHSYCAYEQTPFWRAADQLAFTPWRSKIRPGSWLLDVGCAQGRSTFKLMDLDLSIVGFDVSKRLIRQAIERRASGPYRARATFLAADATRFPFVDESFDYVLVYGVLHHLPQPEQACREVARVLKPGGWYFGSENNPSIFRGLFDLLQRWRPLWEDDAGPEALISAPFLTRAFAGSPVHVTTRTSVFLPPHLINLLPRAAGARLLTRCERVARSLPFLRDNGGLLLIEGEKVLAAQRSE